MEAFYEATAASNAPISGFAALDIRQIVTWGLDNYAGLIFVVGFWHVVRSYLLQLVLFFEEHFTSTVHFHQYDETHDMVSAWFATHSLQDVARSSMVQVNAFHDDGLPRGVKKPLQFRPWNGSFYFRYGLNFLRYRTETEKDIYLKREMISITCIGRSTHVIKDFLEDCRKAYLSKINNKTTIFENRNDHWKKVATKRLRPLSSVVVSEEQKQRVVDDVKSFVHPDTQLWFADRTIPYRRGYLLYGPPGTGKSSFSLSVAGELDLDIYIVNIRSVTDEVLKDLFGELPQKCVILLEDVDAVGAKRAPARQNTKEKLDKPLEEITMSGLLNTLDGVASQEGRILIMTTNHIEKLDEALIRPGRIDMKAEFQFADARMVAQLFEFIYQECRGPTRGHGDHIALVCDMAAEFAKKLPEMQFSPAQIISFLLPYRRSPSDALDNTDAWVTSTLQKRGSGPKDSSTKSYSDTESLELEEEPEQS